ncbi:MAG: hypothetical protein JWN86_3076 [Planctomycetota bacterium]|nr:hypothetical protein [Planctomycetota bacterium]
MGLMGEIVSFLRGRRAPHPEPPLDAAPADGRVEIVPVCGIRGEPNRKDDRFRRFLGIEPGEGPIRKKSRTRGFPLLLGRVALGSLFLDQHGKDWSDGEIAEAMGSLIRAGEWIEREAMRHGAAVNLDVLDTYFVAEDPVRERDVAIAILPEGDHEGLFDADAEVRLVAAASRAAGAMGFRDVADLAERVKSRLACDTLVWLIHPRSAGRSFVVPEADTGMRGVSLAICYAREDDFPGRLSGPPFSDPATFAHELLHLFGASDKYGVPLATFPRGTVTDRDVMRLEFERLSRLRIDPGTAREIGWRPVE